MADPTDAETMQCATVSMMGKRCAYVSGHSGDHLYQTGNEDLSDEIRLKLLRDRRDTDAETIAALRAEVADLRWSLLSVVDMRFSCRDDARQLRAYREIANYLTVPFSCGRVQAAYNERVATDTEMETERDLLRADLARVTAERDEARQAHGALIKNYGDVMDERNAAIVRCNETAERIAAWLDAYPARAMFSAPEVSMIRYVVRAIRAGAWKETP
jgi:hypothetical protein